MKTQKLLKQGHPTQEAKFRGRNRAQKGRDAEKNLATIDQAIGAEKPKKVSGASNNKAIDLFGREKAGQKGRAVPKKE